MDWSDIKENLLNKSKEWLGTAGDMTSASINPEEKTAWMD